MAVHSLTLTLSTVADTARLAQALAAQATAGDCILLQGHIGAGKSELARAFIRARLGANTEVPSPTFTLVQTYEDQNIEIWHADLYRLSDLQEVVELGLTDAFDSQICLVEWPEILADLTPSDALFINLSAQESDHKAVLSFGPNWANRLAGLGHDT